MIEVVCPRCHARLNVSPVDIGTTGSCSKCRGHISILDPTVPVPRSEAPPAPLAVDAGPTALSDIERKVKNKPAPPQGKITRGSLHYELIVRMLIDLNQLNALLRFKRAEIPKKPEYTKELEERNAWYAKMENFGDALLESNMKWRFDNIRDAVLKLNDAEYSQAMHRLTKNFEDVTLLTTPEIVKAVEITKAKLTALGEHTSKAGFGAASAAN